MAASNILSGQGYGTPDVRESRSLGRWRRLGLGGGYLKTSRKACCLALIRCDVHPFGAELSLRIRVPRALLAFDKVWAGSNRIIPSRAGLRLRLLSSFGFVTFGAPVTLLTPSR